MGAIDRYGISLNGIQPKCSDVKFGYSIRKKEISSFDRISNFKILRRPDVGPGKRNAHNPWTTLARPRTQFTFKYSCEV